LRARSGSARLSLSMASAEHQSSPAELLLDGLRVRRAAEIVRSPAAPALAPTESSKSLATGAADLAPVTKRPWASVRFIESSPLWDIAAASRTGEGATAPGPPSNSPRGARHGIPQRLSRTQQKAPRALAQFQPRGACHGMASGITRWAEGPPERRIERRPSCGTAAGNTTWAVRRGLRRPRLASTPEPLVWERTSSRRKVP
jgi:hypothetical protein